MSLIEMSVFLGLGMEKGGRGFQRLLGSHMRRKN